MEHTLTVARQAADLIKDHPRLELLMEPELINRGIYSSWMDSKRL
jgi:hypothetical protein